MHDIFTFRNDGGPCWKFSFSRCSFICLRFLRGTRGWPVVIGFVLVLLTLAC